MALSKSFTVAIVSLLFVATWPTTKAQAASYGTGSTGGGSHVSSMGGDGVWIASAGTAGIVLQTGTPQTTTYNISLGLGHSLGSELELMTFLTYQNVVNPGYAENSDLEVDGQLNWVVSGAHSDAFYLGARIGENFRQLYGTPINMTVFGAVLGKRFSLVSILSFEPTAAVLFYDTAGSFSTPAISFVPLQFTLTF